MTNVKLIRALFIISSLTIGLLIFYPKINNIYSFISDFTVFIFTESLIIYALAMSIRPCLKSIGVAIVISDLLVPLALPTTFETIVSASSLSIILYFVSLSLIVLMLIFSLFFGGIKLQVTYLILTLALLIPILFYFSINVETFSQILQYFPYPALFSNHTLLFYTVSGAIGFTLATSKRAERIVFKAIDNVALPYLLSAFLPLLFIPLVLDDLSNMVNILANNFLTYLIVATILFVVVGSITFNGRRDVEFAIVTSLASLGLGWFSFIYSPYYALLFMILGSSVIPITLPNPTVIESELYKAINLGRYSRAEKYLTSLLKFYSPTKIFCNASIRSECNVVVWLLSKFPGGINYNECRNLVNAVNCIISKNIVPTDSSFLLDVLLSKDKDSAEKFASYLLTKNLPTQLKEKAKTVLASLITVTPTKTKQLPHLESWNPTIWVGSSLYGYRITKVLGSGGSSYVLVGEKNNKQYAIKIAKISRSDGGNILSLFESISKESSNLQRISDKSPNVVKIFGFYIDLNGIRDIINGNSEEYYSTPPAIIMELMEGGNAEDLIKNQAIVLSDYWKKVVALISLNIAKALKVIHDEGYVHLDIKPTNIFFDKNPGITAEEIYNNIRKGVVYVKLGDLGSAKRIGEKVLEYTPQYCPIDQVEAMITGKGADPKMDIYALGATIYKLLTQKPFNPPKVSELMDKAVQAYVKNQPYSTYLEEAKKELLTFHQSFSLPSEYTEFTQLIKAMTSPDPLSRPNIDYVIAELDKLAI